MQKTPLSDRIIATKIGLEKATKSGLITSVTTEEDTGRDTVFARVVAVGPGKVLDSGLVPTTVKEGDIIVYNERVPLKFKWGGEEFEVLRESDVMFVASGEDIVETDLTTYSSLRFTQGSSTTQLG